MHPFGAKRVQRYKKFSEPKKLFIVFLCIYNKYMAFIWLLWLENMQNEPCHSKKWGVYFVMLPFFRTFAATMNKVSIKDSTLRRAATEGVDAFVDAVVTAIRQAIGGQLTSETMAALNADQITLLAWDTLHEEVMDGGFVQLIHNGYGPFIFKNPFAKALRLWGLRPLSSLVYDAHTLYAKHHEAIERDCTDDEFMALFEQFPAFDDLDDTFVEHEEEWTADIAHYIDDHLEHFVEIE